MSLSDLSVEWLETDGLGGWSGSTVAGINTRKYHGVLVDSSAFPHDRTVLLSKLDETLVTAEGVSHPLFTNQIADTIDPCGYSYLERATLYPNPTFSFCGDSWKLTKSIQAIHRTSIRVIKYELTDSLNSCTLRFEPRVAGRPYHGPLQKETNLPYRTIFEKDTLHIPSATPFTTCIHIEGSTFEASPHFLRDLHYQEDGARGYPAYEDVYCPGTLVVTITPNEPLYVVIATSPTAEGAVLWNREALRRKQKSLPKSIPKFLDAAAEQFFVERADGALSIVAGYPWFTDWGRDTMIALPGISLSREKYAQARQIISTFARHIDQGMIPNRFKDDGQPEYNSVDASLWFCQAAYQLYRCNPDVTFASTIVLPTIRSIIAGYSAGTRYSIHMQPSGLLWSGDESTQLTWMDAKIGSHVVTPRHGLAVEICALWHNAIKVLAFFEGVVGSKESVDQNELLAAKIAQSFSRVFWDNQRKALFDVVRDDVRDGSVRPNQLFALGLSFPIITGVDAESILSEVERELITPYGPRTLSRNDSRYQKIYRGGQEARDHAYHNGTVWPYLFGAYIDALVLVRGKRGRDQASRLVKDFIARLTREGHASVPELFDGDAPHHARGAIAQAWSVAELIRVITQHSLHVISEESQ